MCHTAKHQKKQSCDLLQKSKPIWLQLCFIDRMFTKKHL